MMIIAWTVADLPPGFEDEYWGAVRTILADVLGASPDLADGYRARLKDSPDGQRLLAYHQDEGSLASELSGLPLTEEHIARINEILGPSV
jgi:hypothetical protein